MIFHLLYGSHSLLLHVLLNKHLSYLVWDELRPLLCVALIPPLEIWMLVWPVELFGQVSRCIVFTLLQVPSLPLVY